MGLKYSDWPLPLRLGGRLSVLALLLALESDCNPVIALCWLRWGLERRL